MQQIELKPGDRVRCVNASGSGGLQPLQLGVDYVVGLEVTPRWMNLVGMGSNTFWRKSRFKPIFRVKANTLRPISEHLGIFTKRSPWAHGVCHTAVRLDKFDAKHPVPHIFANAH